MKKILIVPVSLFVGLFVGLLSGEAYALPGCTSNFCNTSNNGSQCSLDGVTHTCGKCLSHSGAHAQSLYVGSLSEAEAKAKCEQQYGLAPPPPPKTAPSLPSQKEGK